MKKVDLIPSLDIITKARGVVDDLRKIADPEPVKRPKGKKVADETLMDDDVEEDLCNTPRLLGITTRNEIVSVRKSLIDQWNGIAWVEYVKNSMSRSMSRICEVPDLEYTPHDITTIKQYILATVEIEEQLTELIREFKND